ncbi:hypothetical protein BC827DRAFT_1227929 [Russula dissimulans]|jgi:hypothetical protein|nr:hypothetical protein BC827DRAFT_1227929 [Russula dissimulans]
MARRRRSPRQPIRHLSPRSLLPRSRAHLPFIAFVFHLTSQPSRHTLAFVLDSAAQCPRRPSGPQKALPLPHGQFSLALACWATPTRFVSSRFGSAKAPAQGGSRGFQAKPGRNITSKGATSPRIVTEGCMRDSAPLSNTIIAVHARATGRP